MPASLFKELVTVGSNLIQELEQKFGPITTPEFLQKLNEEQQKALKELERKAKAKDENGRPQYFG